MDQINESVDILVQFTDNHVADNSKMIQLTVLGFQSTRPIYAINQRDIPFIRAYFKEKNWLLLSTYMTMNAMYLCSATEYNKKVATQFLETQAYTLIDDFDTSSNQNNIDYYLNDIMSQIKTILKDLLMSHCITMVQYQQIMYNEQSKIQFNSLVFLPDIRIESVPFRPLMLCISGLTNNMTRYLHGYLQLIYCLVAQPTTFNNGVDAIQAIETLAKRRHLKASTCLVSITFEDLDTNLPHQVIIETFQRFLHDHVSSEPALGISHETIVTLVELILKMQYFIYDNKLYRQTKGGNCASPLIKLLINIYLFYWQQDLVQTLHQRKQIFGRCFNKILFTWNASKLNSLVYLMKVLKKNTYVPMHLFIGSTVLYLGSEITQIDGKLCTKVYRDCLNEPFTLPYLVNCPSNQYMTMIRGMFIKAIQSCTHLCNFTDELAFIHSMCLLNDFPVELFNKCINDFFNQFKLPKLNHVHDEKSYKCLRKRILTYSSLSSPIRNNKRRWYQYMNDLNTESYNIKRLKTFN